MKNTHYTLADAKSHARHLVETLTDANSHARQLIDSVDLSAVVNRLVQVDGWKEKDALEAAAQYRRYLFLKLKYGQDFALPPSLDIDEVWHAHILHTEDYCRFSEAAFGYYLHHHPHHMNGTLSGAQLASIFETQTQRLHYEEFGQFLHAVRPVPLTKRLAGIWRRLKLCLTGKYSFESAKS